MRRIIFVFLTSLLILGCDVFKQPKFKIIVFHDPSENSKLFINGKDISEYPREPKGRYAEDFRIYDNEEITVEIKDSGKTVVEKKINSGSYLVNLSKNHEVSYSEISYGRYCNPCKSGSLTNLDITKIADHAFILPYDFNEKPPDEISVTRSSTLKKSQFFKLTARKKL